MNSSNNKTIYFSYSILCFSKILSNLAWRLEFLHFPNSYNYIRKIKMFCCSLYFDHINIVPCVSQDLSSFKLIDVWNIILFLQV